MFTVRVEESKSSRTVYRCTRYTVREERDKVIIMMDELGDYTKVIKAELRNGGSAYVMNEQGVTVDTIRLRK